MLYCVDKVYWPVVQALLTPNFPLILSVARRHVAVSDADRFARALVAVGELCGTTLPVGSLRFASLRAHLCCAVLCFDVVF